jgi:hypothetical protein
VQKIAFWSTVGSAYRFVFGNPGLLFQFFWPVVILFAAGKTLGFARLPLIVAIPIEVLGAVIMAGLTIAGALALNRAILLAERSWSAPFRFRRMHWRFLGVVLVIFLAMALLSFPVAQVFSALLWAGVNSKPSFFMPGFLVMAIGLHVVQLLIWIALGRLSLAFPAIAIGEGTGTLARAWLRSDQNIWRLFLGWALCWMPFELLNYGIDRVISSANLGEEPKVFIGSIKTIPALNSYLAAASSTVIMAVATTVALAFYAFAYAQLARGDLAQTLAASRARAMTNPIQEAPSA